MEGVFEFAGHVRSEGFKSFAYNSAFCILHGDKCRGAGTGRYRDNSDGNSFTMWKFRPDYS